MDRAKLWLCIVVFLCLKLCAGYNVDSKDSESEEEENLKCNTTEGLPGLNQKCDMCCISTLVCFENICQDCYRDDKWLCNAHTHNQEMLLTATQIAMSAALVLGIITIFTLLWKICTNAGNGRAMGTRDLRRRRVRDRHQARESERSVDTLQNIITERLRDAPPPYVRTTLPPPGDTPPAYNSLETNAGHVNACFDADYNAPPPCYNSIIIPDDSKDDTRAVGDGSAPKNDSETTLHI